MSIWNEVLEGNNNNNGGNEIKYTKFNDGANQMRVLDGEPKAVWSHWVQGANGGKGMSINCLGKGCPMCEKNKHDKANDIKSKDRVSRQYIINVYNRKTKQVEILQKGSTIFKTLATYNSSMGDLRNYDINIMKTGAGMNTQYTVIPVMQSEAVPSGLELVDIDKLIEPMSKEMVNLLMAGLTFEEANKTLNGGDDAPVSFGNEATAPSVEKFDFTQA